MFSGASDVGNEQDLLTEAFQASFESTGIHSRTSGSGNTFENFPFLYGAQHASSRKLYTFDATASSALFPDAVPFESLCMIVNLALGLPSSDQVDKALPDKRNRNQPIVNKTNPKQR